MYEREGEGGETGVVSGADVMAHYKLQQQEKAFGQSVTVDETTGKATGTPAEKKTPEIPTGPPPKVDKETGDQRQPGPWADEYTMPTEPTMAKEAQMQPQTSQGEIDKFNKSRKGRKLQKELGQLFGDDFSNYGLGN